MSAKIFFFLFYGGSLLFGSQNFSAINLQQNNLNILNSFAIDSMTANNLPAEQNIIVTDSISGLPMLLGECTREAFKDTSFNWWWMSEYDLYNLDSAGLNQIKTGLKNVNVKIIMGTWCSDSRREVPRFFKILDAVNYPSDKVEIICVDEDKKAKGDELNGLKIELVPTIIFYKDGNELGRIIEAPEETLEKDMIKILTAHS
jgi:thiol-disulfide isomerase/thioredoxin